MLPLAVDGVGGFCRRYCILPDVSRDRSWRRATRSEPSPVPAESRLNSCLDSVHPERWLSIEGSREIGNIHQFCSSPHKQHVPRKAAKSSMLTRWPVSSNTCFGANIRMEATKQNKDSSQARVSEIPFSSNLVHTFSFPPACHPCHPCHHSPSSKGFCSLPGWYF